MPTTFKEGTGLPKRVIFHAFAYCVNATDIGLAMATTVALSTAFSFNVEDNVKVGAKCAASYLVPGFVCYEYVKGVDNALRVGKTAIKYSKKCYSIAKKVTSPIEFVNYVAGKTITQFGIAEGMKMVCGVEESDAFAWERAEFEDS